MTIMRVLLSLINADVFNFFENKSDLYMVVFKRISYPKCSHISCPLYGIKSIIKVEI